MIKVEFRCKIERKMTILNGKTPKFMSYKIMT